jgi:colanic acid biosynthesis glycosyl transferase WcaI
MSKSILLIGYNYAPEPTGIGKYSGEMIDWLARHGTACTVITAYPYYPQWKVQGSYYADRHWYKTEHQTFASGGSITTHRCPLYVPANPSGLKRMLLDFSFLVTATIKLVQLLPGRKIDTVLVVAPSFQLGLLGVVYKAVRKARFMYHIQDLQIEAARDLGMIKSSALVNLLFKVERYILRKADIVSSISPGMLRRISDKAGKPVYSFPNWADTNLFYPLENRGALKELFGLRATDKVVLYSGAIGEKQGLEAILQAADTYRAHPEVRFVICGSGPYKQKLQDQAASLGLTNVEFLPLQPFEKFNQFLNMADVHLVIQKANASDLVMPSKLTTILAVGGLALITATEESSLHELVSEYQMGLLVAAEDQAALNEGIRQAIWGDNQAVVANARAYAEKYLAIDSIMGDFKTTVLS